MAERLTRNTFEQGRNTDTDVNIINPNFYTEAHNVDLVGDGKFTALTNLRGTTNVENVISDANTTVIGVFQNRYKIDTTENVQCLTIITASNTTFRIYCYDTENDTLYSLYQETVTNYLTDDRIIDAKAFSENGIDVLYFTDNVSEFRQLRCVIPAGFVANSLTEYDLSVQRWGSNGVITINKIRIEGSLLSGSYQFAYRMVDPSTKRFTRWSSLTVPVHVYYDGDLVSFGASGTSNIKYAGVGLFTNKLIDLTVSPSDEELANFDYFQIAVVENTGPLAATSASLLPIELNAARTNYQYKANQRVGTIPIEDIVVDLAPIESVKTLNVKQNRLFLGNVKYKDLDVGTPSVTGSIITESIDPISAPNAFVVSKSGNQTINTPVNGTPVNWQTIDSGSFDLLNKRYEHSGATASFNFTAVINWSRGGTGVTGCEFRLVKNGSTILATASSNIDGVLTLNAINVSMANADYVEVQTWSLPYGGPATGSIVISDSQTIFTGTSYASSSGDDQNKVGYFRDEVYRFGIVYEDKYGNKSEPYPLDLSGITHNQIAAGLTDIKFPARSLSGGNYTILDTNSLPRIVGLQLTIDDHPTWATAFEIVRVKRIKRIQFQTPMIPMMRVDGVGAFGDYPGKVRIGSGTSDTMEYADAQPMTSGSIYVPKNLLWPELRDITRTNTESGASTDKQLRGEVKLTRRTNYDLAAIFPPESLYTNTPYIPKGGESIETVDYTINKVDVVNFPDTSPAPDTGDGNDAITVKSANFYALTTGDYYFHNGFTDKAVPTDESARKITDYQFFDNLSSGGVVGGERVLQYAELQTKGYSWGYQPNVSKMAVIKISEALQDEGSVEREFDNATHNAVANTTDVTTTAVIEFENSDDLTNKTLDSYSGPYDPADHVQSIRIVNIVNDAIGDNRYGDRFDQHEYISTGARHCFTTAQLANVQSSTSEPIPVNVFGGDCHVGYHVFKICDGTYSVTNQTKYNDPPAPEAIADLLDKWDGKVFGSGGISIFTSIYTLPFGLKAVGQFVQVFLESEYHGQVMDLDVLEYSTTDGLHPVLNVKTEGNIKTPLTYRYNINLSKENDQKIYLSEPEINFEQNEFPARILYSDVKIYNTDVQGFDVFRVLNFYDLEEDKGALTKLAVAGDALYGIQQWGVKYLPTGKSQLEQTDAGTISVGTSDVIGRTITVDNKRGCQHLGGVVETGSVVYFPDEFHKSVYALSRDGLTPISAINNETLFRELYDTQIVERNIRSIYDPIKRQYWLIGTDFCHVYSEAGRWVANLEFGSRLLGGVYTNQNMYLMGKIGNQISVFTWETGTVNDYMGTTVVPRVSIVINPDNDYSKVFDNLMLVATQRLNEVDMTVEREQSLGNQTVLGMNLDVNSHEGNYRIKILRDSDSSRLRGLRALATIKWGDVISSLSSVVTKYRLSSRTPY